MPLVQQASPTWPHVGVVSQWPPVHTRPALHRSPAQHTSRGPPQAGATSHVLLAQASPDAQALPEQHGWRRLPQLPGTAQVP